MARAHSTVAAAAMAAACLACLARPALARQQPKPRGHFLTSSELLSVSDVPCLEARQRDPSVNCSGAASGEASVLTSRTSPSSYPNYHNGVCRSHGEYLCDPGPTTALSDEELAGLATELRGLRERSDNLVTCGRLQDDPIDSRHLQPFYLGVAIATGWPSSDATSESLQQFGQVVAADWNMDELYVGNPQPYMRCPNSAVLVILPDLRQAMLSSASCEFLCASRGGGDVVRRTLEALDQGGAHAAALEGMREAYRFVAGNPATSQAASQAGGEAEPRVQDRWLRPFYSTTAFRIYFIIAVVALLASLFIGLLVLFLAPGLLARRAK